MKRLFSILMCGLLLYNIMGFSLVYWIEEFISSIGETQSYSVNTVQPDEFITLKIPIMVPYQTDWQVAEPAEGRLRRGNDFYQIIEQQLLNDTLLVKCKLDLSARDRYLDLVSHVDQHLKSGLPTEQNDKPHLLKSFLKDYLTFNRKHLFFIMDWIEARPDLKALSFIFSSIKPLIVSPPPR